MKKYTIAAWTMGIAALTLCAQSTVLQTEDYIFRSPRVAGALDSYRIALVSDLHGAKFGRENQRLLAALREQQPNLIALTGDLMCSYTDRTATALAFARDAVKIAPCYFVTGNHEHRMEHKALQGFLHELEMAGICVLRNRAVELPVGEQHLRLIGVDCQQGKSKTLLSLMKDRPMDELNVLLSHKPHYANNYARSGVDLVLSGHAHGGQFRLPLLGGLYAPGQGILPEYTAGLYRVGGTVMAVSRGLGNSSFPIRIGNRPELVIIQLKNGKEKLLSARSAE